MTLKHIINFLSNFNLHLFSCTDSFKGELLIMGYKYNVSSSSKTNKIWTQSAIDCYNLGCECSSCTLYKSFFFGKPFECKMKDTVIELIKQVGTPRVCINDI